MANVLIIDDDANDRLLLEEALVSVGFNVKTLASGLNAINVIKNNPMDAVALDLIMPEVEGAETLQAIHKEFPELPIIVMSGLGREYLPMMKYLGAFAVVEKSAGFENVVEQIQLSQH